MRSEQCRIANLLGFSERFTRQRLAGIGLLPVEPVFARQQKGSSPHSPVAPCMLERLRDDAAPLLDIVFDLKQREKRPRAARSAKAGGETLSSNRLASATCPESAR